MGFDVGYQATSIEYQAPSIEHQASRTFPLCAMKSALSAAERASGGFLLFVPQFTNR